MSADLASWLLEQIVEDERIALGEQHAVKVWIAPTPFEERFDPARVLAECDAKRAIIEWHKNWPVLVETPPNFEPTALDDPQSMTLRITKQIAWLTQQQYRERFGDEPPTAPMLRLLALPYADRPGYREEWRS